jgi:beta-phosphoglucomutase-like phosphatase (HAD superfamily)
VWDAVRKRLVLDRAGSASYFRAAVSSEEVPHGKPVAAATGMLVVALSTPLPPTTRARRTADLVLTDLRQLSSATIGRLGANGDRELTVCRQTRRP